MKTKLKLIGFLILHSGICLPAPAQTPTFTYQGRLNDTNGPVTGSVNLTFRICDAGSGGAQLWQETTNGVAVSNGLFAVELGTVMPIIGPVLDGSDRWLEIVVNGTPLTSRQKLTPAPYAIRAANAGAAATAITATTATSVGTDGVTTSSLQNNSVTSAKIANGSITLADVDYLAFQGTFWVIGGNYYTPSGSAILGPRDFYTSLELWANNQPALRLDGSVPGAPNIIGGASGNVVESGVAGATISGGGADNYLGFLQYSNRAISDFSTIGGGRQNVAGGGGAFARNQTVGGGADNVASGNNATVGGGNFNTASGGGATVGGGESNASTNTAGTVAGGVLNTAAGNYAAVLGGWGNVARDWSAVAGGLSNSAVGQYTFVAGGEQNTAQSDHAFVGGGAYNIAGGYSVVGGGLGNYVYGFYGVVPGGVSNAAASYAFGAGRRAQAVNQGAFVWADSQDANFTSTANNQFNVRASGGARFETAGAGMTVDGQTVFVGNNGSGLTSLNASQLTSGTLPSAALAGTYASAVTFSNAANNFSGSGTGLTALNASQLTTGSVSDARLSANVAKLNTSQTFTANNSFLGSVGIGISAGSVPLTVYTAGSGYGIEHTDGARRLSTFLDATGGWLGTVSPHPLNFFVNNGGSAMNIDTNGRVGVGTSVRPHALTVGAAETPLNTGSQVGVYDGTQAFYNARQTTADVEVSFGVDNARGVISVISDHPLVLRAGNGAGAGNVEYMRIAQGGNVGVGTASPTAKLSVNGAANNTTGVWSIYSDRRLKEHIEPLQAGSLDQLLRLQGVTFDYTKPELREGYTGVHRGWIAQDVEQVFPEWVTEDQTGTKMVTPVGINALTVEALRELRAEKDAELKARDAEIADLKARLEKLERLLSAKSEGGQ